MDPVTPEAGSQSYITQGGVAVEVNGGGINGGLIVNPLSASDQGLQAAEPLYVDPVGECGACQAGGTIFRIEPGQKWTMIPGQTTPTFVNAPSSGHKFTVVTW